MRLFHHPWDPETCAFYFYSFFLLSSGVWDKLKLIPRISWNPGVCPLLGNLILTFANYFIHLEGLRLQRSSWYTQKVVTGAYTPLCGSVSMDSRCLFSQNPTVGYGNKELVYHIVMFEVGWWIGWNSVRRDHLEKESFTFDGSPSSTSSFCYSAECFTAVLPQGFTHPKPSACNSHGQCSPAPPTHAWKALHPMRQARNAGVMWPHTHPFCITTAPFLHFWATTWLKAPGTCLV